MRNNRMLTAFLFLLLTLVITSSASRLKGGGRQDANPAAAQTNHSLRKKISAVKTKQDWDALLDRLPEADYNAPDPDDPEQQSRRRVKSSYYDKRGMVVENSDTTITLTEVLYEGKERWPLPAKESDVILVGEVRDRRAYLSNDKSGVYTELAVDVVEVFRGDPSLVARGSKITASRAGGVVRYPNGHRRLYLVSGEGMPSGDGQYILFLKSAGVGQNFDILTMFQLEGEAVVPVDEGKQFEPFMGRKKYEFLEAVKEKMTEPPSVTPLK